LNAFFRNNNIDMLSANNNNIFSARNNGRPGQRLVVGAAKLRSNAPRVPVNARRRVINHNNFNVGSIATVQTPPSPKCLETARSQGIQSLAFRDCLDMYLKSSGASTSVCGASRMTLPQTRVYELAKIIATGETSARGQLVWATTGGGKTLISLAILLAYWDSGRRLFVSTTPDNQTTNSPDKYIDNLRDFFPRVYAALTEEYGDLTTVFSKKLTAKVCFLTFTLFKHSLGIRESGNGKGDYEKYKQAFGIDPDDPKGRQACRMWNLNDRLGSVVVFDEAHGITKVYDTSNKKMAGMDKVSQTLRGLNARQRQGLHVWALTATPGDDIKNWLELLSVVRRVDTNLDFSTCADDVMRWMQAGNAAKVDAFFSKYIDGLVSFSENRGNLKDHACVSSVSYPVPMDRWYYMAYLHKLQQLEEIDKERFRLGMFLRRTDYAPLTPPKVIEFVGKEGRLLGEGNHWVSYKFIMLVRFLAKRKGKHFVYTTTALPELKEALTKWYGFTDVTKIAKNGGTVSPGLHFIVHTGDAVGLVGMGRTKRLNNDTKKKMFDAFDEDDNKDGSRIKIILATGRAFEGTDLKALRYVHIAEPVVSPLMERQLVGRGVRLCGHIQLPPKERTVTIVRWYAMPPPASTRNVMISSAQRAHSGSGKKLPTLLFRNRNTNNVTKLSLTQALQRVRNASDRYGTTGWEYAARNEALQRKDSILLSSFENYVARRASSKTRPSFTLLKKFQIIPGRACPKS
jgi:hypothetical protein